MTFLTDGFGLVSAPRGADTRVIRCPDAVIELFTILDGKHVPAFARDFNRCVIVRLFALKKN